MKKTILISSFIGLTACSTPQSYQSFQTDKEKEVSEYSDQDAKSVTLTVVTPKELKSLDDAMKLNYEVVTDDPKRKSDKDKYIFSLNKSNDRFTFVVTKCSYHPGVGPIFLDGQFIDKDTRCLESQLHDFPPNGHKTQVKGNYQFKTEKESNTHVFKIDSATSQHSTGPNLFSGYIISDVEQKATANSLANHFARYVDKQFQFKTGYGFNSVQSAMFRNSTFTQFDLNNVEKIDRFIDVTGTLSQRMRQMGQVYVKLKNADGYIAIQVGHDTHKNDTVVYLTPTYYLVVPDKISGELTFDFSQARKELVEFIKGVEQSLEG